jgi:uncharacterized phage protein (TIGR01671 family)
MREIKFRAWDKANPIEKMRVGEAEYFDDMLAFRFQHFEGDNPSEIIYEQFTGLHDSKGREIYEGDIVRYSNRTESGVAKISSWIGNNLYFEWINSPESPTNADIFGCAEELEVIGNIHESA